jgi:hypothetical protein
MLSASKQSREFFPLASGTQILWHAMDHASGELSCHGITLHLVSDCRAGKQTDQGSLNVAHFTTMVVPDPLLPGRRSIGVTSPLHSLTPKKAK